MIYEKFIKGQMQAHSAPRIVKIKAQYFEVSWKNPAVSTPVLMYYGAYYTQLNSVEDSIYDHTKIWDIEKEDPDCEIIHRNFNEFSTNQQKENKNA